ncbi:MAG TPA: 3-deoxy-manno-octulosonate cytidylyltransferase, partial [Desulfobaccales bacterium]|nr:3-deoxy-manno-octulosonate cytidylyltransferase [Desulfobaccales bacterium]
MKTVALIPARFASSRFPGKPLVPILGKPLIQWVYEQALQVEDSDGVWVATDEARIREAVQGFGGRALMTRDDHPSGSDRLAEAAGLLNLAPEDIVINIQGDQPVFPSELVSQLAGVLRRDQEVVMVTPARRLDDPLAAANPNVVKVVFDWAGRALYFSRSLLPFWRAGEPPYFYRHIGIYAYRVQFLKEFVHLPPGR